jgi:hypothetical protein
VAHTTLPLIVTPRWRISTSVPTSGFQGDLIMETVNRHVDQAYLGPFFINPHMGLDGASLRWGRRDSLNMGHHVRL